MRRTAARALALGAVAMALVGAGLGAAAWRRAEDRAARGRVAALVRDAETYPERMRREQAELMAERDRLYRAIESHEADELVRRDLRASPEWAAIERERAAQDILRRERDELRQAHLARYRITRLEVDIAQLQRELDELAAAGATSAPPRPPGEDR
jgi:hypothetical protein